MPRLSETCEPVSDAASMLVTAPGTAPLRQRQCVFRISGSGVHDGPDWPFAIAGMRTGHQGPKMEATVARTGAWRLAIVRRCDQHRFVALPKRWIVERTLAWISRNRLARAYERHARKAAAFVRLAMIRLMLRRLAAATSR